MPKFTPARGGGGGGAGFYDATVGASDADYTTLGAAITAGETRIQVIDDTTETGNIQPIHEMTIYINKEATVDMATYQFLWNTSAVADTYWRGEGTIKSTRSANRLFDCGFGVTSYASVIDVDGLTIDESSVTTTGHCMLGSNIFLKNITYRAKNAANGIVMSGEDSYVQNMLVTDGGTSCETVLECSNLDGLYVTATVKSGAYFCVAQAYGVWNNIRFKIANSVPFNFGVNSYACISNLVCESNGNMNLNSSAVVGELRLTNAILYLGDVNFSSAGYQNSLTNVGGAGTIGSSVQDTVFTGCRFFNAVTSSQDNNHFINCDFDNGLTIASGADQNKIIGCDLRGAVSITGNNCSVIGTKVGTLSGGGGNTITVNAGASRTIIDGCRTDAAISNSGSNTVLGNNSVY